MEKMIVESEGLESTDVPNSNTEESLISLEKLDRASPDLWPEESMTKFVAQNLPQTELPTWSNNLTPEDMSQVYSFGHLTINELIVEVKKLHDMAYQLGVEEAKEMTRGKYLNIFQQQK